MILFLELRVALPVVQRPRRVPRRRVMMRLIGSEEEVAERDDCGSAMLMMDGVVVYDGRDDTIFCSVLMIVRLESSTAHSGHDNETTQLRF